MSQNHKLIIGIIITLAVLCIILLSLWFPGPPEETPQTKTEITVPQEPARIVLPLAPGKRIYELQTDNPKRFQIIKVEIEPLAVEPGQIQQIKVFVEDKDDQPITNENKVEAEVFTDNKTETINFKLKEISGDDGVTLTEWEGSWTLDDTYDKIYLLSIKAKSAGRQTSADLAFR